MQRYLEAGKVLTTHGVRGEVKAELWCDGTDFLKQCRHPYRSDSGAAPLELISVRPAGRAALLQFKEIGDMDAARRLSGTVLYFDREETRLPEGRWFTADLIGCEVRDADNGTVYGTVISVEHPGPQDIYTVKGADGKEYMFPGVDAFLKERNPPEGYILVSPIPGMFDDGGVTVSGEEI